MIRCIEKASLGILNQLPGVAAFEVFLRGRF
jgi:hypothetical protein